VRAAKRRNETKEMFWRKALERFAESNLTQVEFCKREGLKASSFCWWKRQLSGADTDSDPRLKYWRKVIARFDSSGQSKDDFCVQESIKPASFCYWRAELNRRDAKRRQNVARPMPASTKVFVPLTTTGTRPASSAHQEREPIAEIDIASKTVRIFETGGAEAENLSTLLRIVREFIL
jgi:hypothetical protein